MVTRLTYAKLAALEPCGLDKRKALFASRKSLTAAQALVAGASIPDLLWVARRLGRKDLCVRFALACARRVAHLNIDPRARKALEATQAWLDNPSEKNRSAARSAAWSADSAADSAAWSAADSAARSAADSAAWSAADSAAWSAARSAADSAAWSAAWSAEREAQKVLFLEIFKDA